jgi:hypothetical protein
MLGIKTLILLRTGPQGAISGKNRFSFLEPITAPAPPLPLQISNNKTQMPNGSTNSPPHHPKPSRRANCNDQNSKSQTIGV